MKNFRESPSVAIHVEENIYQLPKEILCTNSTFFNSAFIGNNFKEALEMKMTLQDTTSKTFDLVVQWIYTGHIVLPIECSGGTQALTQLLDFV